MQWGLLGAGWIAREAIAPALHRAEGAVLAAVGARDEARAAALEPTAYASADYARIIEDPDIDAIYIALDNAGHESWAITALEAGKPVLCEKPLGLDPASTMRMREVETATGGLLVEATWNLWHPRTRRAIQIVADGGIGQVHAVRGAFTFNGVPEGNYRLDPARGGGAMLDVGCYPLTAAAWATNSAEVHLSETKVVRAKTGVDLTVDCAFGFARGELFGRIGVLASFTLPEHQALRIDGEDGRIEFLGLDAFTNYSQPSTLAILDDDENERLEYFDPVDPYRLMVENFSSAVRGEESWLPDPRWSVWVADAIAMATAP